jgi:hypothetical protein
MLRGFGWVGMEVSGFWINSMINYKMNVKRRMGFGLKTDAV